MATNSTTSPLRLVETAIASHRLTSMSWRGKGIGRRFTYCFWNSMGYRCLVQVATRLSE